MRYSIGSHSRWNRRPGRRILVACTALLCVGGVIAPAALGIGGSVAGASVRGAARTIPPSPTTSQEVPAAVSCASASDCIAVGGDNIGYIMGTTDGGNSWTNQTVPTGTEGLDNISCASVSVCVVVGFKNVLTTSDGGTTWNDGGTIPGPTSILGLSCASVSDCMAVGYQISGDSGQYAALATTDGGATWTPSAVPATADGLSGVSCATTLDCIAVGNGDGSTVILATTDGGTTWTNQATSYNEGGTVVSCPSSLDCVIGGNDSVFTTADGGTTWSPQTLPAGFGNVQGISCSSTPDCVVVGDTGDSDRTPVISTTSDGGTEWTNQTVPSGLGYLEGVSCVWMTTVCGSVGADPGALLSSSDGGSTWTSAPVPGWTPVTCGALKDSGGEFTVSKCVPQWGQAKSASGSATILQSGGTLTWTPNGQTTTVSLSSSSPGQGACKKGHTEEDISGTVTGGTSTYTFPGSPVSIHLCDDAKTGRVSRMGNTSVTL